LHILLNFLIFETRHCFDVFQMRKPHYTKWSKNSKAFWAQKFFKIGSRSLQIMLIPLNT